MKEEVVDDMLVGACKLYILNTTGKIEKCLEQGRNEVKHW